MKNLCQWVGTCATVDSAHEHRIWSFLICAAAAWEHETTRLPDEGFACADNLAAGYLRRCLLRDSCTKLRWVRRGDMNTPQKQKPSDPTLGVSGCGYENWMVLHHYSPLFVSWALGLNFPLGDSFQFAYNVPRRSDFIYSPLWCSSLVVTSSFTSC